MEGKESGERHEDLSPTNVEDCSPLYEPKTGEELNEQQLDNKLEILSRVGNEQEPYFEIQKVKLKHKSFREEKHKYRTVQNGHYAQGTKAGLSQTPFEKIEKNWEHEDQEERTQTLNEAKAIYNENNSPRKEFNINTIKEKYLKSDFKKACKDKEKDGREKEW